MVHVCLKTTSVNPRPPPPRTVCGVEQETLPEVMVLTAASVKLVAQAFVRAGETGRARKHFPSLGSSPSHAAVYREIFPVERYV